MKYLKYIIGLFIFAVVVSIVLSNVIKSNTPPFLLDKLEELKANQSLMDSIGGFDRVEYSFNKEDFKKKDTLKYSIIIRGHKKILTYQGVQLKKNESWELFDETLLVNGL